MRLISWRNGISIANEDVRLDRIVQGNRDTLSTPGCSVSKYLLRRSNEGVRDRTLYTKRRKCAYAQLGISIGVWCISIVLAVALLGCSGAAYRRTPYSPVAAKYHRVKQGETLWSIAHVSGVGVEKIQHLNGIRDPRSLFVGQRLLLGFDSSAPSAAFEEEFVLEDARGRLQGDNTEVSSQFAWPVAGGKLISRFGPRGKSFHDGIDISASSGTPVLAARSGRVIYVGNRLSGYGNLVILRHEEGLTTVYAHNRRIIVKQGDKIARGQKIAEVGATGRASGPHLHFEVRLKDKRGHYVAVDPVPLLSDSKKEKPRFRINESLTPLLAKHFNWR